jgi:MFS family permease
MISGTYLISGVLLIVSAPMFNAGMLNATTQTIWWAVIFFFASAGASAGYLTVSEVFPLEVRAKAIAVFFAIAQCFGFLGSHLYGHLIGTGNDPNRWCRRSDIPRRVRYSVRHLAYARPGPEVRGHLLPHRWVQRGRSSTGDLGPCRPGPNAGGIAPAAALT